MNKFGSLYIKVSLLIAGLIIAIIILFYTQSMVGRVQTRETKVAQMYAKALEYLANVSSEERETSDYQFILEQIIIQIDFPVIATDKDYKKVDYFRNVDIDSSRMSGTEIQKYLLDKALYLKDLNPPIKVAYNDSIVFNYINYGNSILITELKYLPYIEFIIAGLFVLLGYIGFSYIKKNEQSSIWVGLSRETAHQLGTPLSSLMGWEEMLKQHGSSNENVSNITTELGKDIEKLNKIAGRFSKIGSMPILSEENIADVIQNVSNYFQKRIPSLVSSDGSVIKKVTISINGDRSIRAKINKDLFEWVIENLFKNALDAIDKPSGTIEIHLGEKGKEYFIDVTDNGRGIDAKHKRDIFRPGFSTKKRGWGLGLSLAKRIIEDYHKGKLLLVDSIPDKGATFRIKLTK